MADTKISALADAAALTGAELLLLSQSGTDAKLALSTLSDYAGAWVRPSDWPAMPATAANQIDILAAVTDDASNYVAVRATVSAGTYNVDWGDGTTSTGVTSATNAEHEYSYADADLGALTTRGYKTALIKITPNTGGANITAFDLGQKHTRASLNAYSNPWLDIQVNCPSATALTFRGGVEARWLERANIIAMGAATGLASLFSGCNMLQSVTFPAGSLQSVTTLATAFQDCLSLQSISFPAGSLTALTTLASTFSSCRMLRSVTFPSGSLGASFTTMSSTFSNCTSLQSVTFPTGSLGACNTIASAFQNCSSLRAMSFPASSLSLLTTIASAFVGCTALQTVEFPAGSLGAALTTIASAFQNCSSLRLVTFPSSAFANVTTTTTVFSGCTALSRIINCSIPVSFSVASAKLAGAQLDEIYTALPSVAATITVSTNHGTVNDDPTIATGKGWTVTGS
jgi:hypothetical protein